MEIKRERERERERRETERERGERQRIRRVCKKRKLVLTENKNGRLAATRLTERDNEKASNITGHC